MQNGDIIEYKIGKWFIEQNMPYGFVVRHEGGLDEYHFMASSNGWISMRRTGPNAQAAFAMNAAGGMLPQPVLVDKGSTITQERISELRQKESLSAEEQEELLELAGLRRRPQVA